MNIEDAINSVNKKPYFKMIAFVILSLTAVNHYAQVQNTLLAVVTPNYTCISHIFQSNSSKLTNDHCFIQVDNEYRIPCQNWTYSTDPVGNSLVSEFNLVCDRRKYSEITIIIWYLMMIAGVPMGWLADKYGRKKVLVINLILETFASLGLWISPTIEINLFFRTLVGISSSGLYISLVWLMEIVDSNSRNFVGSLFPVFGCLASTCMPLLVYYVRNWRWMQFYMILPNIFYVLIYFIPESPRWLFVNEQKSEAYKSLKEIAQLNGITTNINIDKIESQDQSEESKYFNYNNFKSIILTFLLQFATYLFYSAVLINLEMLSKNIFISMCFIAFMEVPGLVLSYFTLHGLTRKKSILIYGILGSVLFLVTVFFSRSRFWSSVVRIFIGSVAMVAIVCCDQVTVVYICELFPTSVRTLSFVIIQLADIVAFISSIYVNKLEKLFYPLPMLIYSIFLSFMCIIVTMILPETKDQPLPEKANNKVKIII